MDQWRVLECSSGLKHPRVGVSLFFGIFDTQNLGPTGFGEKTAAPHEHSLGCGEWGEHMH